METIKLERLAGWGEQAARSIPITGTVSGRKTAAELSAAMGRIAALSRGDSASAWYADNEYLARREGTLARDAFRDAGRLRRCPEGAAVVALCGRFIQAGPVSEERLEEFLTGARRGEELPESEAALIGAGLRAALILTLARETDDRTAGVLFTALRTLAELDLTDALERSDPLDSLLRHDAIYPRMDEETRAMYRRRCQRLARRHGTTPRKEAQTALDAGLHETLCPEPERSGIWYILAHVGLTLALTGLTWYLSGSRPAAAAALLPASELAGGLLDGVLLRLVPPRRLPRLELRDGVGAQGRTICAVSALLADDDTGPRLVRRMEEYRLANRDCGPNLLFALLADLPDSDVWPDAEGQARLEKAGEAVDELNRRYGGGFFLLTREPKPDPTTKRFTPPERKRGAITELCRLSQGRQSALRCLSGDRSALRARYILCLDSDTRLIPGAARRLIGAAMHPANAPVIRNGVVVRGHGLIHPRMSLELDSALATDFSRLYAGQGGTDPYGTPTGELFSDLFGRGGFSGKGVVDAEAFLACLEDRFPENRVLSHDALEGAYLRGAYMGDTELTDAAPVTARSWFRRMSRWTRGDWQNLPWLFRAGKGLFPSDRWRLFDSARRSLTAPAALAAILLALCLPQFAASGVLALVCLGADAARAAFAGLFMPTRDARLRCRSGVLRGLGGSLTRCMARIIFLPWEAFTCLGAVWLALWRMTVSHRNLLQWTTAAQGDRAPGVPIGLWLSVLTGAVLVLFAPGAAGRAAGVLWLLLPVFDRATCRRRTRENGLTESDRAFLQDSARSIWAYFTENCTRQDHWLPPDNVQIQPPKGAARRTSPTNIGLAMASAVAAMELELCSPGEAADFAGKLLSTMETLPRWHGHLYNWYDTGTCAPLQPAYVSTVDSGNLCACLIAAAHGFRRRGDLSLSRRIMAFAGQIELGALYDPRRRLFYIGLDPESGVPSPGHYDLMASEARLTSYLACARGEVPLRHWQALSRAQLSLDGWRGLASWSGSMFEYLMPELFLPLVGGSMLWETGRFCLYAQRRRGQTSRTPWGSSESGFFSLDAGMDYRYKAHGAAALALRRDMSGELVIAPYASYLALCVHPRAAVRNLRRLKRRHMWGQYGPYEALDLTPGRAGREGEPVMSFMSHHLGMSLCAAANCLKSGVMRGYFMEEPSCAAFRPLLAERVPLGGPVLRRNRSPLSRPPENRSERPSLVMEGAGFDPERPAFFPMSNGVYSLLAGTDGSCHARSGGILVYRPDGFRISVEGKSLTPDSVRPSGRSWRYGGGVLTFSVPHKTSVMTASAAAASGERGELRHITGPSRGGMEILFCPVLAKEEDYRAHPAFWGLGLEASVRDGSLFVRRIRRGGLPELWLCMTSTVRLNVIQGAGWQMLGPIRIRAELPEGGCACVALCLGTSREEALSGAKRSLTGGAADMPGSMASLLGMNADGLRSAFALCSSIAVNRVPSGESASRQDLWALGISGDLPLVYVPAEGGTQEAKRILKRYTLLTACGVRADLLLHTGSAGEYLQPAAEELRRFMDRYGLSSFEGVAGGVHFGGTGDQRAAGVLPLPPASDEKPLLPPPITAAERGSKAPALVWNSGSVGFQTPPLPPRAWSNVMANERFGFLAADCGTGFMWDENAHERPVSPWLNDPLATDGGETLELINAAGRRSLFADGVRPCRVIHGFGWSRWETEGASVTAFIPVGRRVRVMIVEGSAGSWIGWHLPLSMGPSRGDVPFVVTGRENGCLTARNPRSAADAVFRAVCSREPEGFTCHAASWRKGCMDGRTGGGLDPCFSLLWDGGGVTVLACGFEEVETLRSLARPDSAAKELIRVRDRWRTLLGRVRVRTPDRDLDRLLNGWAAYQALSCRVFARTSMYQNGGAFGFRDQLQDVVNVLLIAPELARSHILTCCARQFLQGDVLHWWHETTEGPKGVRTRCSDDLLWLPWALCEYVEKTGDSSLCREPVPYLDAPPLGPEEKERFFIPSVSETAETALDHGKRALDLVLERGFGPHGLLLTGSGDWNDGMDHVGGESVWLTWFFAHTAKRFAALMRREDADGAEELDAAAERCVQAAERAWDGSWYLRGWWHDGAPLGAAGASACAVDSIAQSWAAFCPGADRTKVRTALRTCADRLYDEAHGLTALFAPPFGDGGRDPGYIRACGPGFRENGGQYTHGAVWLASALMKEGFTALGASILLDLMPVRHDASVWGAEPYVLAADVSTNPDHYGEANWSWYTGSAGWFFRTALEDLLGIRLRDGHLVVEPRLPAGWEGYEADICGRKITVRRGKVSIS